MDSHSRSGRPGRSATAVAPRRVSGALLGLALAPLLGVPATAEEVPAALAPSYEGPERFSSALDLSPLEEDAHPWSYSGDWGPDSWGSLSDEFATCDSGRSQSPIDIADAADAELPELELEYGLELARIVHTGHAIGAEVQPGSWLRVGSVRFELEEFHFHTPSENRIAGRSFPLEAHFAHRSADGDLAMLAVFYEEGDSNASVGKIAATSPWSRGAAQAGRLRVRVSELLPESRSYYLYNGSLSKPPCTEGVRWFVMQTPQRASREQIAAYRQIVGTNARGPQPLHRRIVLR